MNFNRATDYVPRQLIEFYLRVLRGGELFELFKSLLGREGE
jgi:hypothetical protein